nr:pentatricopeptide repeat-containing protein At3g18020 [Ipomoea trifida]
MSRKLQSVLAKLELVTIDIFWPMYCGRIFLPYVLWYLVYCRLSDPNVILHDRNVDEALRLFDQLRLDGYCPDSLNLSSVIHALCDARRFPKAHRRFFLAISAHSNVNESTCNVIIARLLDSRSPESTLHVIRTLFRKKPEFVPSLMNYNRLMDQFCDLSRPRDAHQVFLEMRNKGHCPNVVSYTTL